MKKTILIAALVSVFSATSLFAQDASQNDRAKARMEQMNKLYDELGLNQDQKDKLKVLNEDNRTKMQAIRNDNSLSDDQKRAKMEDLRKEQKTKRDAILTPDQIKKWDARNEEMRKNRPQGNRGNR